LIENFPEIQILGLFQTTEDAKLFIDNNLFNYYFRHINADREWIRFVSSFSREKLSGNICHRTRRF
jgi:hypothetical protein